MNVQQLIEALQKHEPGASAIDALSMIERERERVAREFMLTPPGIRALYVDVLAATKAHVTTAGEKNAPDECALHAFNGVRSMVHAALEIDSPPPDPHPDDEGDKDLHWARQKAHGMKLWKRTDALVAAAGLTEKGLVS